MLSQRNNLLLEHQLLSYAEELHSLQTTLAFDDLPALRAKLSLSKNTTRHLRDYLQDKVNLLRFLTKAKYNLSTARDLLRTTLHWRAVSDYPFLVSTTTPQPTLLSGDSTPTSYFSSSLPLQLGNNSPLHETTFPTELAALGRLSPPPTTVQPLDDPRLHRFLNSGLFYFHKKDNLSRPIAWLTLRHYVRHSNSLSDENDNPNSSASTDSLEELKRFVVFVFEIARRLRLEENSSHHQFVICIDLKGAGLSQLDLEVVPAFLSLYRHHYPGCIAAVHVLNYGWMYAGAWALAKRMLSEETRQRISFPTKVEIVRLLGEDSTPVEYGGTDTYVYTGPSTNDVYASYGRLQQTSPLDGQENTLDPKEETDRLTITTLYTNEKGEVAEQSPGPALSSKESPLVTTPLGGSRLRPFTPIAKSPERNKRRVEEETHKPSKDHDETESTANNSPTDSETVYYSCSELASADCSADEEEVISKKQKIKRTRLGNSSIGGLKPFSCVDVGDVAGNVENSSTTASRVVELESFPESLAVLERSPNASRSNFIIASLSARISEARAKIQGLADEVGEEPSTSHDGNERVGGEGNSRRRKRDGLANFARNLTRAVLGGESSTGIKKEGIGFPTKRVSYCWGPDDTAMEIVAGEEDDEEKYEEKELTIRESSSPDPSEPRSQAVSSPRYILFPISSTLITSTMPSSSPSTLSLESLNNHNTIFSSPSAFSTTIRPTTPSRSSRKLGLARFLATALFTLLSLFRSRGLLRCGRHPITELPRCRADSGMADEECGKDEERNSGRLRGRKRNVTWMLLFWPSWLVVLVVKTFWKIGQVRSVEF